MNEEYEAKRKAQLQENIKKANQARREIMHIRADLKEDRIDPYELIRGNHERYEGRVSKMEIRKLLPMIRGVGQSRTLEVIVEMGLPMSKRLGDLSWQRREELARLVADVREVKV